MTKFNIEQIKGVIPALLSVYRQDETIDVKLTENLVEHLLSKGVHGFYLTGSTGECFLMTPEERMLAVKTVVDKVAGRVPVIVHIGDIGTKKSVMLAQQAQAAGADAISSVPPFYFKFDDDAVFRYYRDLASATDLPLIIYNIQLAGLLRPETIFKLAEIPQIKGLKYTGSDHGQMGYIKHRLGAGFRVYSGMDEMAFSGLSAGADGIIGSFYNAMPKIFLNIYNHIKNGDYREAARLQGIATDIIIQAVKYNISPVVRVMLKWQGIDAGCSCRPFKDYTPDEMHPLKQALLSVKDKRAVTDEVDFYKYL